MINFLLIIVLTGLMHAARSFSTGAMPGSTGTTLAMRYGLLAASFAGGIFKEMRLPKLTGYTAAGIVAGPHVLDLISQSMVDNLTLVNGMAVALIALGAGVELEYRTMRPLIRSIG